MRNDNRLSQFFHNVRVYRQMAHNIPVLPRSFDDVPDSDLELISELGLGVGNVQKEGEK